MSSEVLHKTFDGSLSFEAVQAKVAELAEAARAKSGMAGSWNTCERVEDSGRTFLDAMGAYEYLSLSAVKYGPAKAGRIDPDDKRYRPEGEKTSSTSSSQRFVAWNLRPYPWVLHDSATAAALAASIGDTDAPLWIVVYVSPS